MRRELTIYVCPECGTVYADPSNVCECQLPEGVDPEAMKVVPADYLQGAVARAETAERLVALYREYGSPDLTRLVEGEAKRLDRIGGQS